MCTSCCCNSQPLGIKIGPTLESSETTEEHNEKLYKHIGFSVEVAAKDYFEINKGNILFINCNDPSFVIDKYPPKRNDGTYIQAAEYYTDEITLADAELMEGYFEHINECIGSTWDFSDTAKLFASAEFEGVKTMVVREMVLWLYGKLVQAAEKIDTMKIYEMSFSNESMG